MDREISKVDVGNGVLDNNYYLYESGKIVHIYDRNMYKFDIEEILSPEDVPIEIKKKLLEQSSPQDLDLAKSLLGF